VPWKRAYLCREARRTRATPPERAGDKQELIGSRQEGSQEETRSRAWRSDARGRSQYIRRPRVDEEGIQARPKARADRCNRKVRIAVAAQQKPSLVVGVADDRIQGAPQESSAQIRALNAGATRIMLLWESGQAALSAGQAATLAGIVGATPDIRVILSSRSRSGVGAPLTDADRSAYCSFLGDAAVRFPQISDFGVWIEPNKQQFWAPQYDSQGRSSAPAAYAALLARCYDVLHGIRGDANVIGPSTSSKGNDRPGARSNISHSPATFIWLMGDAYRASGHAAPLFDSVGHHPYGTDSAERAWRQHSNSLTIGLGD